MATNDIGRVTPIWRGIYSAAAEYELNDIVLGADGTVWWHKGHDITVGTDPAEGNVWGAVIDMGVFGASIREAIETAQAAVAAAQEAAAEVTADTERAETAADNAENSAAAASESAAGVGALAQAAERSAEAAAGSATGAANSASAAAGSKSDAEAYAVGKRGGEDVGSTDPTYHNNAKYYAEQAASEAEAAAQSAEDAQDVLNSIPEDYSQLSADVGDLKTQVGDLKKDLYLDLNNENMWTNGSITSSTGSNATNGSDYTIRTNAIPNDVSEIMMLNAADYKYLVFGYTSETVFGTATYVGWWTGSEFSKSSPPTDWILTDMNLDDARAAAKLLSPSVDPIYFRVEIRTRSNSGNIGPSACDALLFGDSQMIQLDSTLTQEGMAADAKATGDIVTALNSAINTLESRFAIRSGGVNLYDEAHNSEVQTNPEYTVGTIYLYGYTGDITVSCAGIQIAYVTPFHVYDANGDELNVSWGNAIYAPGNVRSGKVATIPTGAVKIVIRYRTYYSGGDLVKEVMVTKGNSVPVIYEPYKNSVYVVDSPYVTQVEYLKGKVAFVSPTGDDDNDGLTISTPVASLAKALTIGKTVYFERGEYNIGFNIVGENNIKLLPYNDGTTYSHENPKVQKVVIRNGAKFTYCDNLYIEDFIFNHDYTPSSQSSSIVFENCDNVELLNCEANSSAGSMGFEVKYTNIIFKNCSARENHIDGFNFHGYGSSIMENCIATDNDDDGCSHHDGCTGAINGGRFSGSGKAGIAPAYGAEVNIYNAVCDGNIIGIGYLSASNGHASMKGIINGCVMASNTTGLKVDPLCTVTAINCKYNGNTDDKVVTGTLVEY